MSESKSSTSNTATDLIKAYQELYDRVSAPKYRAKVKDRKDLQNLYPRYTDVANNDETALDDLSTLQDLLSKTQQIIR